MPVRSSGGIDATMEERTTLDACRGARQVHHKGNFMRSTRLRMIALVAAGFAIPGAIGAGSLPSVILAPARAALDESKAASAYYEDALILADGGELKAAVIQLKNALGQNPEHLAARMLLGEVYIKLGYSRAALDAFTTAAALGADDTLVVVPLFRAHLLSRNYQTIMRDIDLDARPRAIRSELLVIRGHAGLELGNYVDAEKDFSEAAILSPSDSAPLVGKALVNFNRGSYGRAETLIDRAIELEPDVAAGWFIRGEIKRVRVINEAAIENYSRALLLEPSHYKARLARAGLLIDSGRFDAAKGDLEILQDRNSDDPQVSYFNALIMLRKGEWQDAEEALDDALAFVERQGADRHSRHPQYVLLAGVVRLLKGDREQAFRILSDYVDVVPDDPVGRIILGRVLLMMNEPARALNILRPVKGLDAQSPELYTLLGTAHMQLGNFTEATELLDEAVLRADDVVPLHMEIVRIKIKEGNEPLARQRLSEILKMKPGSIEANYTFAYLEIKARNFDKARHYANEMMVSSPRNPTGFNLDGIILLAQGKIPEAKAAFEVAQKVSPLFFSASHNLAQLDLAEGNLDKARARYETLLQRNIRDLRSMNELVKIAKYEGKWDEAIERLEKIRSLRPTAWAFWMELSDLYLRTGDEERATAVVEQLGRLAPDDIGVLVALGRADLLAEKRGDARRTFARAAAYAKENPEALRQIAKYMVLAGGLEEAEKILLSGIKLDPRHLESHVSLIALYANQDRFEEAFAHAKHVRTEWPKSSLGHMLTGDIYMRRAVWPEALKSYEAAAMREDTAAIALRIFRASFASSATDLDRRRATERLRDYSGIHPGNKTLEQALASAMSRDGNFDAAQELLQKLLTQNPEDIPVLNDLAVLYTETGDPRAVVLARRAYALDAEDAAVLDTLGWALTNAGEPAEALGFLREANVRASRYPEIHYHLAVTLKDLERPSEALREVKLALKTDAWFDGRKEAEELARSLSGK